MTRTPPRTTTSTQTTTPTNQGIQQRNNQPPPVRQQRTARSPQHSVEDYFDIGRNLSADMLAETPQLVREANAPASPIDVKDSRVFEQ